MTERRAIFVVLDSVGIGEMPDAADFGDVGSDTLGHIAESVGLNVPNMVKLGLGNIRPLAGITPAESPQAVYGKLTEESQGKDTATGHWEFCGVVTAEGFSTFPDGFPSSLIEALSQAIGVEGVLGNKATSGTAVIKELGQEHVETGKPIVYTSADPVLQIAAHEDVVPVETLYAWCEAAYKLAVPAGMSRVIARPFVGEWPNYTRTHRRRDFAVPPPGKTLLDALDTAGIPVTGVGKIKDIFSGNGITHSTKTKNNADGIEATISLVKSERNGLIFTNLVDFDALYGHRRNPQGYADCLAEFDQKVPELLAALRDDDLLIISADHGNDPTYKGTDHTREYVPILVSGKQVKAGHNLGTRASFADIGQTLAEYFGIAPLKAGTSFLSEILA